MSAAVPGAAAGRVRSACTQARSDWLAGCRFRFAGFCGRLQGKAQSLTRSSQPAPLDVRSGALCQNSRAMLAHRDLQILSSLSCSLAGEQAAWQMWAGGKLQQIRSDHMLCVLLSLWRAQHSI